MLIYILLLQHYLIQRERYCPRCLSAPYSALNSQNFSFLYESRTYH